jgi:hypothetical protein
LTATPASGWVFSSWGGACSGATRVCNLLMSQARDVTVFFVEAPASTPPSGGSGFTSNPITIPSGVQWSVENLSLVARFAGTTGLTYTIRAIQGSTIKTGACLDDDSAITCTVRVAAGTWTGEVTPNRGATSGTPVTKKRKVVAVGAIRSVAWGAPRITKPLVATFTAKRGTTYRITAKLTKAAKTRRIVTTKGSCKIKRGKTTCSIKLKTRGTWSVTITPKKNGSLGKPVKKTVKV